jgi:hypothetical protein
VRIVNCRNGEGGSFSPQIIKRISPAFGGGKIWRLSQVGRQRSAKPLFSGSNPEAAFLIQFIVHGSWFIVHPTTPFKHFYIENIIGYDTENGK